MPGTELVRKESIEELCGHRDRALALYAQAARTLLEARRAHKRAVVGGHAPHVSLRDLEYLDGHEDRKAADFAETARACLDAAMWRGFVNRTRLGGLMDNEERDRFERSLTGHNAVVPEATAGNVEATLLRLCGEAGPIFRRGLVNAFRGLSREYRSNDGFKIGERIVLAGAFSVLRYSGKSELGHFQREAVLRDVDRVMHVLDGKPAPAEHGQGLCGAIDAAPETRSFPRRAGSVETPYWRARWFLNGNMHLWPLRPDLVESANRIIAEHYGAAIGDGKNRGAAA